MSRSDSELRRQQLEQAIAVQKSLCGTIDDTVIDVTIEALHIHLNELQPAQPVEQQRKMVTILRN
jgi:hypothetical protein